ncbi:MAG TPA: M48 family metalloprotease [Isosphaeraceae bacterium]|nr:M48 family metalloprotease [Isosphaeraceae bacterium]
MRCPSKVRRRWRISVFLCAFLSWISGVAQAAEPDADHSLLKRVSEQLESVASPVPDYVWPPTFEILADKDIQAFACDDRTPEESREGKKVRPSVVVHSAMMTEVIQGDADRLALILGHELGHVVLRHIESPRGRTPFVQNAFTRDQEYAADDKGMELALAAGFSRLRGLKALRRAMELGPRFVSFEALGHDHPPGRIGSSGSTRGIKRPSGKP